MTSVNIYDHNLRPRTISYVEEIAISKFKATCLAVLERVRKTGQPVRLTRFGKPVGEIVPGAPDSRSTPWLGSMKRSAQIVGDIVGPIRDPEAGCST